MGKCTSSSVISKRSFSPRVLSLPSSGVNDLLQCLDVQRFHECLIINRLSLRYLQGGDDIRRETTVLKKNNHFKIQLQY